MPVLPRSPLPPYFPPTNDPFQLLLLSGLPTSGKTHRAQQFVENFSSRIRGGSGSGNGDGGDGGGERRRSSSPTPAHPSLSPLRVVHISDASLGLERSAYDAGRAERDARAAFASAVKRELGRDTIVVADGMNYIKGFRYQLYCEARGAGTTSCVVQPAVPPSTCRSLNARALAAGNGGYEATQFENLLYRHEEPDGRNRWDAPLFVVPHEDEHPPYDAVWEALMGGNGGGGGSSSGGGGGSSSAQQSVVVRPHRATVLKAASEEGHLMHLERVAGEVVRQVEAWAREHVGEGGEVTVVVDGERWLVAVPTEGVKGPQLQRLKRQFVALNRVSEVDKRRVAGMFVEHLNDAFQE